MRRSGRWLIALVVCSAVVRTLLARRIAAPWIMVDELIYSELAKSFAAHGRFEIRGVTATGYGFVYPVLIAPAWRAFHAVGTAYRAAQAVDAVVMSLAAVPAFLLARRVVGARGALAVALLTVLVPSMLYTGTLMTENVFYPLFLVVVFVLVTTLLRPTPLREGALLALLALAFETRQQGVVLVPAAALAPILYGALAGELRRVLRSWATFYGLGAAVLALGAAAAWIAGSSPLAALGAYRTAASSGYAWTSVARYVLWHTAELDLYLGAAPFAALVGVWLLARRHSPELRAFAAATLPVTVLLVLEVAAFASTHAMRIEERNLFYVAPLAFVALAAVVDRAAAFDGRAAVAAVAFAGA